MKGTAMTDAHYPARKALAEMMIEAKDAAVIATDPDNIKAIADLVAAQDAQIAEMTNSCAEPRVKPLVWDRDELKRGQRCYGRGLGLGYGIAFYGGDVGPPIYRWAAQDSTWSKPISSLDAAKAACQADYERRIREALE